MFRVKALLVFGLVLLSAAGALTVQKLDDFSQFISKKSLDHFLDRARKKEEVLIVGVIAQPPTESLRESLRTHLEQSHSLGGHLVEDAKPFSREDLADLSFFPTSYSKWIHRDHVMLVPLDTNRPISELLQMADRLGGLLMPGGKTNIIKRKYYDADRNLIDYPPDHEDPHGSRGGGSRLGTGQSASELSDIYESPDSVDFPTEYAQKVFAIMRRFKQRMNARKGLSLPIHGTCLGFHQTVLEEYIGPPVLRQINNLRYPAEMRLPSSENNILRDLLTQDQIRTMETGRVYYYNHKYSLPVYKFHEIPELAASFEILGVSMPKLSHPDPTGTGNSGYDPNFDFAIVAALRHRKYPFLAVQFHPEKNEYETHLHQKFNPDSDKPLLDVYAEHFYRHATSYATEEDVQYFREALTPFRMFKAVGYKSFDELVLISRPRRRLRVI